MGLKLHTVAAGQGIVWVRRAFGEFFSKPLAYAGLLASFMFAALVVSLVPLFGAVMVLMAVPLLTLGFMMATKHSLRGQPVRPAVYLEPWRNAGRHRRTLVSLGGLYALATLGMMLLSRAIDGGAFDALINGLYQGDATPEKIAVLVDAPGVTTGAVARMALTVLLSVPFWYAPALVQWNGQGLAQALFSSVLALWRARAAFIVFLLAWGFAVCVVGAVASVTLGLLGEGPMAGFLVVPAALLLTTVFYVSLYFGFVDSFGEPE